MTYELLANRPAAIPVVAEWLNSEWGNPEKGHTLAGACRHLRERMSTDRLPLHLLAIDEDRDEIVGFAAIKFHEMPEFEDREHWLGSVYVDAHRRGEGIATGLVQNIMTRAKDHGVTRLSLQTEQEDGGLYARLGWRPVLRTAGTRRMVTVMERSL